MPFSRGKATVPKTLEAGRCKVCKKPRVINMQKGVPVEEYLSDPFCSSACARKFYGTELPKAVSGGRSEGYVSKTHT